MYLFLCNLSCIDLCFTTIIVPNLLYILVSGDNTMSLTQCCIQIYFFFTADCAEVMVLVLMAYDRYVAICHPLHYHHILNKDKCMLVILLIWISACVNSSFFISSTFKLVFCSSRTVHQFFCDAKALINISCGGTFMFYIVIYVECLLYGLVPVVCNLMSYLKIIRVILLITPKEGRHKAFSTCLSHLIIMVIYYGSGGSVYLMPKSDRYSVLEQILTVFFTTVVPMMNPLIYSLRNTEVKSSLRKLVTQFLQDYAH
ncbi:olfactory receptor 1G1-like [Hyperolius riggenbachi]|uniref:olfactory receptor 1G1-like n=1 Tax=Hyperolius riggenbachi TaxID=752182 RepID=UPI0035A3D501